MANFAPIDYGVGGAAAPVQEFRDLEQATAASGERSKQAARKFGDTLVEGSNVMAQGILHTQVSSAGVEVAKRRADVMKFIEENNNVTPAMLDDAVAKGKLTPSARDAVLKGSEGADPNAVIPMYKIGTKLYDEEMKSSRANAAKGIATQGWRNHFLMQSEKEDVHTRQSHIDNVLAKQLVNDNRATGLQNFQQVMDLATTQQQVDDAISMMKSSPLFHASEKHKLEQDALARKDRLEGDLAMRNGMAGYDQMKSILKTLEEPGAQDKFKHLTEDQRVQFAGKLRARMHSLDTELMRVEAAKEKFAHTQDDRVIGSVVQSIAQGNIPDPSAIIYQRDASERDKMQPKPGNPMGHGFFSGEKSNHALNIIRSAIANEREKRNVSDPQTVIALSDYFIRNPDGFKDAVLSGKPFEYVDSAGVQHAIDITKQLAPGDLNHQMERASKWGGPEHQRMLEEQTAEQRRMLRADAVIRDTFGDDPYIKGQEGFLSQLRIRVLDAEQQAQRGITKRLTPDEMTAAMAAEAKLIKSNPLYKKWWFNDATKVGVKTKDGAVEISFPEQAAIRSAAEKSGNAEVARMTPEGFTATAKNYYENYDKTIKSTWAKFNAGKQPTDEQRWMVYFKLRSANPQTPEDAASFLTGIVTQMRQREIAKSKGGYLNGRQH